MKSEEWILRSEDEVDHCEGIKVAYSRFLSQYPFANASLLLPVLHHVAARRARKVSSKD